MRPGSILNGCSASFATARPDLTLNVYGAWSASAAEAEAAKLDPLAVTL